MDGRRAGRTLCGLAVAAYLALLPAAGVWLRVCRTVVHAASNGIRPVVDVPDIIGAATITLAAAGGAAASVHVLRAALGTWTTVRNAKRSGVLLSPSSAVYLVADDRAYAWTGGLIRPSVVVSAGMRRLLSRDEFTALLEHEQSHVRHRDAARYLVAGAARRALFFLPVAVDLERRVRLEAELRADAETRDQDSLARALVRLARTVTQQPSALPSGTTTILPRLERLARRDAPPAVAPISTARVTASALVLSAFTAGGLAFVAAHVLPVAHAATAVCAV